MQIMIGVDGSPASLAACGWAGALADSHHADVLVVSALSTPVAVRDLELLDDIRSRHIDRVQRWCAENGLGRSRSAVVVPEGPPGSALTHVAERRHPDLVIVGTEGTSGRFGPRLGSVANHLAHRLHVPLLVIPVGRGWRGLREVVIGVDGSPASRAAVDAVTRLLCYAEGRVTAVSVHEPMVEWVVHADATSWYQQARRDLERWTAPLGAAGHPVEHRVCESGHPAPTILGVAGEVDADLVAVGMHPLLPFLPIRPGGTAFQLLNRAATPTLLVPAPSGADRHGRSAGVTGRIPGPWEAGDGPMSTSQKPGVNP